MDFQVEFTTSALKDLKRCPREVQKYIIKETIKLERKPFPHKKKIKKIKGLKFACYRLRIDLEQDSFRLFYGMGKNIVFILRIVSKKDADKIIKNIRKIDFPPPVQ